MCGIPKIEPEEFSYCPVLLAHSERDNWTDVKLSKLFFNRLKCNKSLKILENAGHFPIEQPGLKQLEEYAIKFIREIVS